MDSLKILFFMHLYNLNSWVVLTANLAPINASQSCTHSYTPPFHIAP